ncbi:hypothetical protein GCM10023188_35900 [Pontibacter saemangeumensis]|uniref:Glycosyl transferase family 2 n=1 Tax=Pontibacter saemangeumensis TaxID=1084525 RepID=A0ABP8LY77_9BACT
MTKIIVLTPVKNEAWILDRFLQVCSAFADHIIIADQNSTDGSLEIYPKYPKVTLILNNNPQYDEAERQLLLLNTARTKFGINNILIAIDADEILAADAMLSKDWTRMLSASPGTVLYFEKPTFYKNTSLVIRYFSGGWPLGYVDDGAEHKPSVIHSTRIPTPLHANKIYLEDIKFLHYALIRLDAQASKQRMYSMLENINQTKSLRLRLRHYNSNMDFSKEGSRHEASNHAWFKNWEEQGIDMHEVNHSEHYWYDYECLKLFERYGTFRFMFDDVWKFDWENFQMQTDEQSYVCVPKTLIKPPYPLLREVVSKCFHIIDKCVLKLQTTKQGFK